ncbi:WhiB family transcriptional regulator [Crossiella sp. CA198]|uniref:WhiB family transcriptional regulator n=1 Tax=Crossiella sp. CA198 TaxID=3455607 RepID=UPI003F8D551F
MSSPSYDHPGYLGYRTLLNALFGPTRQRPAWHRLAACATRSGRSPHLDRNRVREAKAICAGCPVLAQCRTDALTREAADRQERDNTVGVLGGMSAAERLAYHRRHTTDEAA